MKKRINLWLIIGCVFAAFVMVFSKILPIIQIKWSAEFCAKWNDLLFGLSSGVFCSLIVALVMYYYTDSKPRRDFSRKVMPILKQKVNFIHQTYNEVFKLFGPLGSYENSTDDNLMEIMKNKVWADKIGTTDHTYAELLQEMMLEIRKITTEVLSYNRYLTDEQVILLEEIVNVSYSGSKTAKKCTTNSSEMQKSIITGNVLINWLQLYDRDTFVNDVFIPSYRKLLEIEKSFNTDQI